MNEPLSRHTYFKIGGPCRKLVIPETTEELLAVLSALRASGEKCFVLGLGSNLLVSDHGFEGTVIKMNRFDVSVTDEGGGVVHTGAALGVFPFLRRAASAGWGGLEFLAGVPGSVGGAIAMNAGTHLGETRDRVVEVRWCDAAGQVHVTRGAALRFGYRKNLFLTEGACVLSALWRVDSADPAQVAREIGAVLERRKQTQPVDLPNCGSVFMNPPGHKAWEVIEKLGLRGERRGGAQISEKHANFIVNHGDAKAADVVALMDLVIARARDELGITMEPEVRRLGLFR